MAAAKGTWRHRLMVAGAGLALAGGLVLATQAAPAQVRADEASNVAANPPAVRTTDDGTEVQRTPSEADGYNAVSYNVGTLHADERGCGACHDDLAQTVANIPGYTHLQLDRGANVEANVDQCVTCHYEGDAAVANGSFADIIHGIHGVGTSATGTSCFSCHDVSSDGTLVLWDDVKHEKMRGITQVPDVEGDFTFTQDETLPTEDLFNINYLYKDLDITRWEHAKAGDALDDDLFDDWTITVSGEVEHETTFKLTDLIDEAPSVTTTMKYHCDVNPLGGNLIGQAEVTGIPISWLLDKAGLTDKAVSCKFVSPDGHGDNSYAGLDLDWMDTHEALLVYEINGERLDWQFGYPVQAWLGGTNASRFGKQVSDLIVSDTSFANDNGEGSSRGINKPNVGITNTLEGQVIEAGKPYTFEGYADAWESPMTALDFSMDDGQTWTRYELEDTNVDQWVTWKFTWTPDAGSDSAYVLQVRGVDADGDVTPEPIEVMVNAKTGAQASAEGEAK